MKSEGISRPNHRWTVNVSRAVHHRPTAHYRSNRTDYRIDRIELDNKFNFFVSVFRCFFGLQASHRVETLTPDRSRAPRRGKKIRKFIESIESIYPIARSTDRSDRSIRSIRYDFRFFGNVGELEICQVSKFQLCTTFGGRKNAEKPKRKILDFLSRSIRSIR